MKDTDYIFYLYFLLKKLIIKIIPLSGICVDLRLACFLTLISADVL